MAKFLNKKEQVIDLKLTSYAKYLLSIGRFKPHSYAFFDDNVLYDKKYADEYSSETQSNINTRVKDETQYLETYVHFRGVEKNLNRNKNLSLDVRDNIAKTQIKKALHSCGKRANILISQNLFKVRHILLPVL